MSRSIYRGMQLGALFLFGLVSGQAGAADGTTYGIGAGASSNGVEIYFPIRTGSLIIEPRISYFNDEDKTSGTGNDVRIYPSNAMPPDRSTTETSHSTFVFGRQEIGLGIFSKNQITDEIEFYYGGRFGYLAEEQLRKTRRDTVDLTDGYTETSVDKNNRALEGYFLAPTVGLQYFPRPNFSLGIEVAFRYENLSGNDDYSYSDTTNNPSGYSFVRNETGDADSVNYRTVTSAVIRGYF